MQAASTKFGLYVGSIKFNTQSEEWISIHVIICITLPGYFSIHHGQYKCCDDKRKNLLKNAIHDVGYGVAICIIHVNKMNLM